MYKKLQHSYKKLQKATNKLQKATKKLEKARKSYTQSYNNLQKATKKVQHRFEYDVNTRLIYSNGLLIGLNRMFRFIVLHVCLASLRDTMQNK